MPWSEVTVSDVTWAPRDAEQPYVAEDYWEPDYVNDPVWTVRAVLTVTWNEQ